MTITVKSVSEMFNKDVFTDKGVFMRKVADIEVDLSNFRLRALIVEAARGSFLANMVGGKKGVIIQILEEEPIVETPASVQRPMKGIEIEQMIRQPLFLQLKLTTS